MASAPQDDPAAPAVYGTVERARDLVLALLFALGLAAPSMASWMGWGGADATSEKRVLAPFPSLRPEPEAATEGEAPAQPQLGDWIDSLSAFPKGYETWFDDHFAYRSELIHWHHRLYVQGAGVSPRTDVVMGKEGWLFTNASDQEQAALDQVRGLFPFTEEQLREWQDFLEECRDWFEDRGVPYHLTIAPSKPSIHPEYLPDGIEVRNPVTRLDQLRDWLEATPQRDGRPGVSFVDLRPALLGAKAQYAPLYRRTDTHWNGLGALIATAALVDALRPAFPSLPALSPEQFEISRVPSTGGDLAANLSLAHVLEDELALLRERVPVTLERQVEGLAPVRIPSTAVGLEQNLAEERQRPFRMVQPGVDLPRLLMFRDSYASNLVPFLARAFSSSSYYWQYRIHDPAIMALERPDVVVQEIGERVLMRNVSMPRNEVFLRADLEHLRAFRASDRVLGSARPVLEEADRAVVTLPLDELPAGLAAIVRVAGDFPQGARVTIRLFKRNAAHKGWVLADRETIPWKDVVYARAKRPDASQRIEVTLEGQGARDVTVELRAVPRRPEDA